MRMFMKKMKGIISIILLLSLTINGFEPVNTWANTFNYSWIGSASESGLFSFSDGASDSAGFGYAISGVGKVFCINQGSEIYNNDDYDKKSTKKYVSEGRDDFSYDAVIAKICLYYQNNKNSSFAQSLTQALIWQVLDKGYSSKSAIKKILKQTDKNADDLFEEIFYVSDEIDASITTYKSSGKKGTQRMAYLDARIIKNDAKFGYVNYEKSMTYRQIVKFHKVDADGKPIKGVIFAVNISDIENLYSVSMQKGELLRLKDVDNEFGGFDTVYEVDGNGKVIGTNVTKNIDQLEESYKNKNGELIIFVRSDSNGDVKFRLSYKATSKKYAYGKYKEGDGKWQYVKTYEQMQKLSDNTNPDVMVDGHTYYYWMKKTFADSNDEGSWVGYRKRARCNSHGKLKVDSNDEAISGSYSDLRKVYEGVNSYIGIAEVKGVNGNSFADNMLSINPELDGGYKWINIKKNDSFISKDGSISASNKTKVAFLGVGKYSSGDGGTYTNSDYVDANDNSWLSLDKQEENENSYSVDGAKITTVSVDANDGILNAYYKYAFDELNEKRSYSKEFGIHKLDEDGNFIANAEFEIKINSLQNRDELVNVFVNGKSIWNDDTFDKDGLRFRACSDSDGYIYVKLEFEKDYSGYSYGYGKYYDYDLMKYVDVESVLDYGKLSAAEKFGIKEVVEKAHLNKEFVYFDNKSYSKEGGKEKAIEAINAEFEDFKGQIAYEKTNVTVKEIDVLDKDYYAINKEFAEGKDYNFSDEEILDIIDSFKHFSVKIFKVGPDGIRKLDGAVFAVYEDKEFTKPALFYDKDGNVINDNGEAVTYTTKSGEAVTDYLRCGEGCFYLKEVKAPDGYVSIYEDSDDTNDEIKVSCDGSEIDDIEYYVDEAVNVEVKNNSTKIKFLKKDADNKSGIDGAKITIMDKEGNVVYDFTSDKNGNLIEGILKAGEQYVFHEEKAPKGYEIAKDIKVDVNTSGDVQVVEMFDGKISVVKAEERNKKEDKERAKYTVTPKTGLFIAEANENGSSESDNSSLLKFILLTNLVLNLLIVITLLRGNKNEK